MIGSSHRRRVGVVFVAVAASLVTAACGSSGNSGSAGSGGSGSGADFKVGVIVAQTGAFADYGKGEAIAAQLAADQINAKGGVNGHKIDLVIKDEAGKPDQAISVARELMDQDKVDVLLGPGLTTTALAAFPIINKESVPAISPSIVDPTAAPNNRPWTFTIGAPADILFPANFDAIKSAYPGVKKLALAYDPACAGCVSESKFITTFMTQQGYTVANSSNPVSITTNSTDLGAQASAIAALKPDAVIGSAAPGDWARLALALKQQGLNVPAFSGTGPSAPAFVQTAGPAGNGWTVLSAFWAENPDPAVQAFVSQIQPKLAAANIFGGQINSAHALYYDSVNIVAQVLKSSNLKGTESLENIRKAIDDGIQKLSSFQGVCGTMSMQPDGRMKIGGYNLVAKDGKFVKLGS
jgi:branched-chain amino acid transport system substrate-binding protein